MARKKNAAKRKMKSGKKVRKKATPTKVMKRPKKMARKKPAPKSAKKRTSVKKLAPRKSERVERASFPQHDRRSRAGDQSGDLQGLSRREAADSESVDELIEEGNAFEADVVAGVESADDADEKEVRTHEVPEDDVPSEYLDKD
jgi:hypothetical protein